MAQNSSLANKEFARVAPRAEFLANQAANAPSPLTLSPPLLPPPPSPFQDPLPSRFPLLWVVISSLIGHDRKT